MGTRVWPVLVAAAVVGGAIAGGLLLLTDGGSDDGTGATPTEAAEAFLDAYERSRLATFVVDQRFTRTAEGRGGLSYGLRIVQRPPGDRLVVGAGSAEGRVGGRVLRCATRPDGTSDCFDGGDAGPYDEEVAAELARLRRLVDGPAAAYEVAVAGDGCFALTLAVELPAPPYGDRARFCFDAATGAPTTFEVERPEATDLVEAVSIAAEVTDADLQVDGSDLGALPEPAG